RPGLRRLPRPAVPLRRARRADPCRAAPSCAARVRAHDRRRDRDRPADEARDRRRPTGRSPDEGVRAVVEARERPKPSVHEGRAPARRMGVPLSRSYAYLGLAPVPAPAPPRRGLCPQRLGCWLLPTRRLTRLPRRPSAGIAWARTTSRPPERSMA